MATSRRVRGRLDAIHPEFRFDPKIGRYRWRKGAPGAGQLVREKTVQKLLERQIDRLSEEIKDIGSEVVAGNISLRDWQKKTAETLKRLHGSSAVLAHGGHKNMDVEDWLKVGRALQRQYYSGEYTNPETGKKKKFGLKHLAKEIKAGDLSEAKLRARLGLYARTARLTYWDSRKAQAVKSGRVYSFRTTTPGETCPECILYESWGILPYDQHHRPGEHSRCGPNCKCTETALTLRQAINRGYVP